MKTLIFFGSARKKGKTKELLDIALKHLDSEVEIIDAYRYPVKPCIDCRYCWEKKGCAIKDDMQEIYNKIDEVDNIIFAAPMYFHSVPGPLKTMIDRLQVYWAGKLRGDKSKSFTKKGLILMVGGAPHFTNQFAAGEQVLRGALGDMRAQCIGVVNFGNSDVDNLSEFKEIEDAIINFTTELNQK